MSICMAAKTDEIREVPERCIPATTMGPCDDMSLGTLLQASASAKNLLRSATDEREALPPFFKVPSTNGSWRSPSALIRMFESELADSVLYELAADFKGIGAERVAQCI